MTLETFFEKFDQFADAPDAVAKMRELMLTLAVQGKLVEQNPYDQPASMLLEEIEAERALRFSERKTKNPISASLQTFSKESEPFQSPTGWAWVKLGALAEIERGGSPRPIKDYITDEPDGLNWIKIGDTEKGGRYITSTHEKIRKEGLKKTRMVYPGDFLLTNSMSFGRPYITKIEGCIHDGWLRIHPPKQITPEYLYHLLSSSFVYALFCKSAAGAVVQNLNADKVRELPIPLPPLAEQKRIVAKVDELMALCDRLEAQQQERDTRHAALARASLARFADAPTPANLDFLFHPSYPIPPADLRKSILTLAVQGKLVPQDPKDESGQSMLDRITSKSKSKATPRGSSPSKLLKDLPFGLPPSWSVAPLGGILDPERGISYGVIKLGPEPQKGGVFILRCSNVRFRRVDLTGVRKVTEELSAEYGRTILKGGEVLINVRGTLGGCAVVPPEMKGFNIAREVAVVPAHSEFSPEYILNVIASPYFQSRVEESLRGIAYSGLNLGLLRNFLVPVPPLAEQRRIVAKVDQLMALVDELETQLTTSRATAQNLLQALVAELTTD